MANESSSFFRFLQRHRVLIGRVVWPLLILYVFGYRRIPIMGLESAAGLAGLGVVVLGLAVRSLSAGTLHKNDVLATEGIYAIVRNPLYLGSLLLLLGVNIIIADPLTLAVSLALFAVTYVPTIRREEQGLAHAYGEHWQAYIASTPRLLPRLSRLGALRGMDWSLSQWRKNHEHHTVLAAFLILALLELYNRYLAGGH